MSLLKKIYEDWTNCPPQQAKIFEGILCRKLLQLCFFAGLGVSWFLLIVIIAIRIAML